MCFYYTTLHHVEELLVSPTNCLISLTIVGRTKARSLSWSQEEQGRRGEGWVCFGAECRLQALSLPAIQGKLKILCRAEDEIFYTQRNEYPEF